MLYTENLEQTAIIAANKSYTYTDLLKNISNFTLKAKNANTHKVVIFAQNAPEWIFAFYGGWNANCTIVPIDFLASSEDILHIIYDCNPGLMYFDETTKNKIDKIRDQLPQSLKFENILNVSKNFNTNIIEWNEPKDKEKTAIIIYTSGTTGSPKGVELSYKNLIANISAVSEDVPIYRKKQQVLMLLPLHHIFPLAGSMLVPLYMGGTIVISPSMQSSDLLKTFANNNINLMIGVPKLYNILYQGIKDKFDKKFIIKILFKLVKSIGSKKLAKKIFKKVHKRFGGNLHYIVCGGAALDKKVGHFFHALGFNVLEGYGMTEASPMITFTRPNTFKAGSPGQALPKMEIKIKDGEIIARGPNIMKGYYNRPEETAEVLKNGWLHTGDLGKIDSKGFLHITGRKKDIMVLPSGKNINPVLLEQKLEKFPQISEAALFLQNGFLHALLIPNMKKILEDKIQDINRYFKKEILPSFNNQVTSYKRIMKFALINEELPRTRLGKIQRFKLPELFKNPTESKITTNQQNDSEEYLVLKTYLEQQVDMTIAPKHHIEIDIALDSLDKLSLIEFIDHTFGVKIDEEKLRKFPSLEKMAEHIKEHKLFQKFEIPDWSFIIKEKVNIKLPKSWFSQVLLIKGLKYLFLILFRLKSNGKENIPKGPAIIAPNHQSYFDALFATAFLSNQELRKTFFYAKRKHVKSKFMNFMAGKHNVIVVDLNQGLKKSIQKMAITLKQNKKIVIFPEGTRTHTGKIGDFKKTFAILSKELNVPVVPVAIDGAYRALPRKKKMPRLFTKVTVTYKPPVYPGKHNFDSLTNEVRKQIKEEVCEE